MSMELITSATSTSSFASFDFQNIPSSYTDLMIIWSARNNSTSGDYNRISLSFNGQSVDSPSNMNTIRLFSEGRNSGTDYFRDTVTTGNVGWVPADGGNRFGVGKIYILNYANTSVAKVAYAQGQNGRDLTHGGSPTQVGGWFSLRWNDTAAINRITIDQEASSQDWGANSYASLYGITKGGSGTVSTS